MSLAEQEAIKLAKSGNHQAFRQLVEAYQGFVYSIAYRFINNQMQAEDITQETFIRLWRNLDKYNPEFKLKTWLGKIVTNLSLDYLKSADRKRERNILDIENQLTIADTGNHEQTMQINELQNIIIRLADELNPKQRAAFILRDLEMLEVDEVCQMLNLSAGNLKSNLYYARQNIKAGLEKYYKNEWI